jgi:hypothetical protein
MTKQRLRQFFYSPDVYLVRALKSRYILPEFPKHALLMLVIEFYEIDDGEIYAHEAEFGPDWKTRLLALPRCTSHCETHFCTHREACNWVYSTVKYCTQDSPSILEIVRIA